MLLYVDDYSYDVHRFIAAYGLAALFSRFATSRRSVRLCIFLLGVCFFFDDYSSLILSGAAWRNISDSVFMSREKLAYIVHTTATDITSIAPISSWIGYYMSLIQASYKSVMGDTGYDLKALGWETSPFMIFLLAIPSMYYPIFSLIFSFTLLITGRDFGPMLKAERRAYYEKKLTADDAVCDAPGEDEKLEPEVDTPQKWWNGVVPISLCVVFVILGLILSGIENCISLGLEPTAPNIFGNSDSYKALLWGSFGGWICSMFMFMLQYKKPGVVPPGTIYAPNFLRFIPQIGAEKGNIPLLNFTESMFWSIEGIKAITVAILILVLAWALGDAMDACGTGSYVASQLQKNGLIPGGLPAIVYILSASIGFATGASWGAMAIMTPLAVMSAFALKQEEGYVILNIAAVFSGSIFGDNGSLISDSCILSSISCKIDPRHHCGTQLPYELIPLTLGIFGYLSSGFNFGSFPNYASLLVYGAVTSVIAYLLSVPVVSNTKKKDPLSRLFGKCTYWHVKSQYIGGFAGFLSRQDSNEKWIRLKSAARYGSIVRNTSIEKKLNDAFVKSGSLSKLYYQSSALSVINSKREFNALE